MEGKEKVVLVTQVRDFWITPDEARKVCTALANKTAYITIHENVIAANSVRGVLQPKDYTDNAKQRHQSWVCKHGNVHKFDESCGCARPLAAPQPPIELDISEHEKQVRAARAQAMREYVGRALKGDRKLLKDAAHRDQWVETRTAEILDEQDQAS